MPYATLADMLKRFNDEGMSILAGDEDGVLNEAEINASLYAATEEADSYLRARVRLPLTTVPEVLVGYVCDLARYKARLWGDVSDTTHHNNHGLQLIMCCN